MIFAYIPPIGITWAAVLFAVITNGFAIFFTFKDPAVLKLRMRYTFIPIFILALYWFIANSLQFFTLIDRPQYLQIISPVAPISFIMVWGAPALSYIFGVLARLKVSHQGN